MAMAPQILAQGQQRLQGVPTQFEPRFMERSVPEFTLKTETVALWSRAAPENCQLQVHKGRRRNLMCLSVFSTQYKCFF